MIFDERTIFVKLNQPIYIVPWGDVQSEKEYPRLEALISWLTTKVDEGAKIVMFGMGDYFEAPSPSDQAALSAAKGGYGLYEDAKIALDGVYGERMDRMVAMFKNKPILLTGLLKGHHQHTFCGLHEKYPNRASTDEQMAHELNARYYGQLVALTLNIETDWPTPNARPIFPFHILATHGYGSARTPGARLTKRIRMRDVYGHAHWYVMGHDDEKLVYPLEAIQPNRSYLKQYFTGSGSFQRGYNFDSAADNYIEQLMLPPAAMGVVICTLTLVERNEKLRLDYHVSS